MLVWPIRTAHVQHSTNQRSVDCDYEFCKQVVKTLELSNYWIITERTTQLIQDAYGGWPPWPRRLREICFSENIRLPHLYHQPHLRLCKHTKYQSRPIFLKCLFLGHLSLLLHLLLTVACPAVQARRPCQTRGPRRLHHIPQPPDPDSRKCYTWTKWVGHNGQDFWLCKGNMKRTLFYLLHLQHLL